MTLLVIILVLIAQRFLGLGQQLNRTQWIKSYLAAFQSIFQKMGWWSTLAGPIVTVLPLVLIVAGMQWLLHQWILSIVRFFFDFAVLWWCVEAYPAPAQPAALTSNAARAITCDIFLRSAERLFAPLFWFILLGPVGAVGYFFMLTTRDLAIRTNSSYVELVLPAEWLVNVLNWLPVRAVALSYALVGHFVSAFQYVRRYFRASVAFTPEFAIQSGFAGLNMEHYDVIHADAEENQAAFALIERALYLWVVAVALFTLGGWL